MARRSCGNNWSPSSTQLSPEQSPPMITMGLPRTMLRPKAKLRLRWCWVRNSLPMKSKFSHQWETGSSQEGPCLGV